MTSDPTSNRPPGGPAADPQTELEDRIRQATIGEYEIKGELGRGGMATVYLAHDIALDRKVAIKVMTPTLGYSAEMVERFRREARTAAALSHPNIIPIYAVRAADGLIFFIMKLVRGTPLDGVLSELGPLPIPMVQALLSQVGGALGYAHRQGVVHRDVKPGNILIDEEGWAVVTDFGIAKVLEADHLTLTGMAVGTPTYMSPEQCEGGEITGASDQYSLGAVAYEMLAGRPPFRDATVMSLMYSHVTREPPPLGELRGDCPEPLRLAVERMLRKDPAERWPSLEEAIGAVGARTLSHDDPTRTRLVEVARTGMSRKVVAAVQTPRSPVILRTTSEKEATPPTPVRRRARPGWLVGAGVLAGVTLTAAAAVLVVRGPLSRTVPIAEITAPDSGSGVAALPPPTLQPDRPPPGTPVPASAGPEAAESRAREPGERSRQAGVGISPQVEGRPAPPSPLPPAPPPPPPAAAAESTLRAAPPEVTQAPVADRPVRPGADSPAAERATVDERPAVEAVVLAYARALEQGNLAEAIRLFPSMPVEQRQGLESFYRDGGSMQPRWTVSEVNLAGSSATLRIQGTNVVRTARTRATEERVNLRARLERTASGWRLTALVN